MAKNAKISLGHKGLSGKNTLTYLLGVSVGDEKEKLLNQHKLLTYFIE